MPRRRKRLQPLTRDEVLQAAVTLADAEGIDALSMRSLAAAVQVEAMSLYNHVENKDDVLDGMVDRVAAQIALPSPGGPWKVEMQQRAISAHEVLMRHPWATQLIVSRPNVGPAMLRYVDATIGCFRAAGFSYPMADYAWNAIDSHVYGFTLQKLNFPFAPDEYTDAARENLHLIPADAFPHLHGMAREVIEGHHDGQHTFEFGLHLLLDGLEKLL
ncbi:MAG: TetR/AcrR family transcriptional regulator C-terminal domain-containing protein [Verrucomicrobiota bacterium]